MKKMLKKILCAATVLSMAAAQVSYVHAAEDMLLLDASFDSLADGVRTSLTSSDFYHVAYDYSGTGVKGNKEVTQAGGVSSEVHTAMSTSVGAANGGRSGKAFIYNVNGATAAENYTYDFKWAPDVYPQDSTGRTNMQVTYEFSLRAPDINVNDGYVEYDVMIPIDGYKTLFMLQKKTNGVQSISVYDKTNGGTWVTVCNWEAGRWYNLAVTLTPGTNKLDYYLNGELVRSGIYSKTYDYAGGRFRIVDKVTGVASASTPYTSTMAIDDIRIYIGTPELAGFATDVSSSDYRVSDKVIYIADEAPDHDTFIGKINVANEGSVEVYKDSAFTTVADTVTEGCYVVATSNNKRVLDYYTVGGREVLLDCDMESSYGIAENKVPSFTGGLVGANNTGKGSLGLLNTDYVTTSVKEAGAAKDGYAYFFSTKNETSDTVKPGMDFKFVPDFDSGKVTFEISMLAPDAYDTVSNYVHIPYNKSYKSLFLLANDGKLGINNKYICQWIPGRWYNFAVEFTIGSGNADFYLNGDLVLDDEEVYVNLDDEGKISAVGGRLRFEAQTLSGKTGVTAIDDVKIYTGGYDADRNNADITTENEEYTISDYGFVFIPEESVRVNVLNNNIDGNFTVYEDDSFENTAVYTALGNVLVSTSESSNIVKYYNLIPDGNLAVIINDSASNSLSSRENVSVGAMARYENSTVYAASYGKDGVLKSVRCVSADNSIKEPARVGMNHTNEDYTMLMLWDTTTNSPICEAITIK